MWLCIKWHGAWLYGIHRTCQDRSHASTVSTPLRWIFKNMLWKASHSCRIICGCNESSWEQRISLYKSKQHVWGCVLHLQWAQPPLVLQRSHVCGWEGASRVSLLRHHVNARAQQQEQHHQVQRQQQVSSSDIWKPFTETSLLKTCFVPEYDLSPTRQKRSQLLLFWKLRILLWNTVLNIFTILQFSWAINISS